MPPIFLEDALDALAGRRSIWRGMSARLLALTVLFVLLAEVLIFLPSASNFRRSWLDDRVEAAQIASLAVAAAPDFMVSDELAHELLANAGVTAVAFKRDGQRQLVLSGEMTPNPPVTADLRTMGLWRGMGATLESFFAPEGRYLRIVAEPSMEAGEFIEVVVPEAPLRRALFDFSQRIAALSIFISIITGALVYLTLVFVFVRPMRRFAAAMTSFREDPEDPTRAIEPSGRTDEIGRAERELAMLQAEVRQALRQKERLAALGEAVAKINHDLRNVLTSAQLVSDRLAQSRDPKIQAQGERLVRAIDRGIALAESVLSYGKSEERAPERRAIRLRPALEEAFADAAAAAKAPTGVDMDVADDMEVLADPEQLHRIFLNLMRNAVQAMAAQEYRARPGMLSLSAKLNGNGQATVKIADDGPGVPRRVQERLFQPFSGSGRPDGAGLGLSIARELARAQGGEVILAETGRFGSTFEVTLQAA